MYTPEWVVRYIPADNTQIKKHYTNKHLQTKKSIKTIDVITEKSYLINYYSWAGQCIFVWARKENQDIWLKLGFLLNVISQVLVCCVCVCLPLAYTRIYTKSGLWKPFLELQLLWRRSNPFVETRSPKINWLFLLSVYSVVGTTVCVQIPPPFSFCVRLI